MAASVAPPPPPRAPTGRLAGRPADPTRVVSFAARLSPQPSHRPPVHPRGQRAARRRAAGSPRNAVGAAAATLKRLVSYQRRPTGPCGAALPVSATVWPGWPAHCEGAGRVQNVLGLALRAEAGERSAQRGPGRARRRRAACPPCRTAAACSAAGPAGARVRGPGGSSLEGGGDGLLTARQGRCGRPGARARASGPRARPSSDHRIGLSRLVSFS